ncbi:MAG: hypothetical protein KGR24_07980 [Planctomycetes bacterium]|nr:hypothetical protein [Planctomycetota bacterium]
MAGDWLKMRHDLADDPAVIRVASLLGVDEDAVIGKLFRLWSWADRHTASGDAEGLGLAWVDRLARCPGFGAALVRAGWLVESEAGLSFPRFDRHCSDTAKARALTKNRVEKHRNAPSVTDALPEKRKRREEVPPPPREASLPEEQWRRLRDAWNAGETAKTRRKPWKGDPPAGLAGAVAAAGLDAALEAVERMPGCRFFTSAVVMSQIGKPGFIERVLGGQYDEPKQAARQGRPAGPDDRPPAQGWQGDDAARFEATKRALAAKLRGGAA